ncbi:MarR family transcriptional regulator [Kribbella turkmenica]|uniref:MarR family transcriptional regulator n=1 Tax=Kribbella turkmenica TaxID=2530375 RepID=A0A4V2YG81_9ACTN|nr:MarR family transcriptional regulator [Kribbella turkmenica]TDD26047.1 MarR family transcriptional regulator [Kribbella turkmenica]
MVDHLDLVLEQWAEQRPDLDASPMGVVGRVSRLNQLFGAQLARNFARFDVDRASFDVLATLRRSNAEHSLTPAGLMRSSMVTSGAISQRLDRLEARGLVTRAPSETDGRGVRVTLTDEGLRLIDSVLPAHIETEQQMLAGLSTVEREQFAELLRTLLESLGDTRD